MAVSHQTMVSTLLFTFTIAGGRGRETDGGTECDGRTLTDAGEGGGGGEEGSGVET